MRQLADEARIGRFMASLGRRASSPSRVYLTGGATAVLFGWRATTIDLDLKIIPEADDVLRALPRLKNDLQVNVEIASPDQFIPELPGWQERSRFIRREGPLDFFHYDFYAQALSKIERGHAKDRADVDQMMKHSLIEPERLLELFEAIEPKMYRYPALDPTSFRRAVEALVDL